MISLNNKKDPIKKPSLNKKNKINFSQKPILKPKTPLTIVKKEPTEQEMLNWIKTLPGFIQGLTKVYDTPFDLYGYQIKFMESSSSFKIVNKSRQVGMSLAISADSFAKSQTRNVYEAIYISINREEASNKIDYARMLYESLPLQWQKKKIIDNKFSMGFESGGGKHRTSLISLAQRAPRGPGFNVDVYLDEFAHFTWDESMYIAALPIISRGDSSLSVISTPLGNKNQFYKIWHDRNTFSEFSLFEVPWWICEEFCNDVDNAIIQAPSLSTTDRIIKFSTSKLKQIFKSMEVMDFQQEYECMFVDEATAYFPLLLIKRCLFAYEEDDWLMEVDKKVCDKQAYDMQEKYPKIKFKMYNEIEDLLRAIQKGEVSKRLYGGYDVGRKKDSSCLTVVEEIDVKGKIIRVPRLILELNKVPFRDQEAILDGLLKLGVLEKLGIDATGMGAQLGENLETKYRSVVIPIEFTNYIKSKMAKKFKICLEDQIVGIPDNNDTIKQIHSIRRTITENSNEKYDVDKNMRAKHHADRFWALALSVEVGSELDANDTFIGETFDVGSERIFKPMVAGNKPPLMPDGEFDIRNSNLPLASPITIRDIPDELIFNRRSRIR